MQLVDAGRNDPCPCGSGRKYKKCCLGAHDDALAGDAADIKPAALVDHAIASDDWDVIDDLVDIAMEVFEVGAPLEHVRFRDDLIDMREPDDGELGRLCPPGWLARCQLEIAHVLERFDLEPEVRDGLRMAAHLVRRFGVRSPIVEELVSMQVAECADRRRRFADGLSSRGIAVREVASARFEIAPWVERVCPPILSFAEWFALQMAPEPSLETIWMSGIARGVAETCLERVRDAPPEDAAAWAALAGLAMLAGTAAIGVYLAQHTPLREPTADEHTVYDAIQNRRRVDGHDRILRDIVRATAARGDFVGAALIRETMRVVQNWKG